MAKLNNNVDLEALKADIEALKNAQNEEEVNQIKAKYADAVNEMNEAKAKSTTKKAPVKVDPTKVTPKKTTPKKTPKKTLKTEVVEDNTEAKGRQYNGKYEVYQDVDGYCYRLKASNGEVLVVSETYTTRDGVIKAIEAVKKNIETGKVTVFVDKRGKFQFKLTSKNYRVLVLSANYSTEKGATRASESFKKFALKADVVDVELSAQDANTSTPIEIVVDEKQGGKFTVEKFNKEYSWDLKASNGQILCQAEGYTSKKGCLDSIETFKKNVETGTFKCIKDKNNRYFFKLYSSAGRVSAIGESYPTKDSAESAANSVVNFYKSAEIVELKEEIKVEPSLDQE